jgi:hypothetical protein
MENKRTLLGLLRWHRFDPNAVKWPEEAPLAEIAEAMAADLQSLDVDRGRFGAAMDRLHDDVVRTKHVVVDQRARQEMALFRLAGGSSTRSLTLEEEVRAHSAPAPPSLEDVHGLRMTDLRELKSYLLQFGQWPPHMDTIAATETSVSLEQTVTRAVLQAHWVPTSGGEGVSWQHVIKMLGGAKKAKSKAPARGEYFLDRLIADARALGIAIERKGEVPTTAAAGPWPAAHTTRNKLAR